ncbi:hypothetical protein PybrP1_012204 [[Pythium] brassicae (nom. inval.)]|nr:hypothetical protein PybrP1_012204 [[Pythium] brassicae (nom. inval.)]
MLFAVPASSAQMERDFGSSDLIVTRQRARLASSSIHMCSFLCRKSGFVDTLQFEAIDEKRFNEYIPKNVAMPLEGTSYASDLDEIVISPFSGASIDANDVAI